MSTREVAAFLRVHRDTLKKWRAHGKGPAWIRKGWQYAYRRSEVERWLAEQGSAATTVGLPVIPPAPPPPRPAKDLQNDDGL